MGFSVPWMAPMKPMNQQTTRKIQPTKLTIHPRMGMTAITPQTMPASQIYQRLIQVELGGLLVTGHKGDDKAHPGEICHNVGYFLIHSNTSLHTLANDVATCRLYHRSQKMAIEEFWNFLHHVQRAYRAKKGKVMGQAMPAVRTIRK